MSSSLSSCSRLAALAGRMMSSLAASTTSSASTSYSSCASIASSASAIGRASAPFCSTLSSPSSSSLFSIARTGLGAAGVRSYIRVPVNRNQIDRALRDINRICQADDVVAAWRNDRVFTRPAVRRVVERKASERRLASKRFKAHMRWVMARRERGF